MASETPTEPVATTLNFEQLRTRLPKEITDDIVRLVATSEEALQDFLTLEHKVMLKNLM